MANSVLSSHSFHLICTFGMLIFSFFQTVLYDQFASFKMSDKLLHITDMKLGRKALYNSRAEKHWQTFATTDTALAINKIPMLVFLSHNSHSLLLQKSQEAISFLFPQFPIIGSTPKSVAAIESLSYEEGGLSFSCAEN